MSDVLSVQGGKRMHNEGEGQGGTLQSGSWPQDPISISYYNGPSQPMTQNTQTKQI